MAKYIDPLSRVKIASPCSADWEHMLGNERRRLCAQCELNVYNLSGMTGREAEEFLNQTEGQLCVRFYRRADGTILTQDCPAGLRALKRRLSRLRTAAISSALSFLAGLGLYAATPDTRLREIWEATSAGEPPLMGAMIAPQPEQFDTGKMVVDETGVPEIGQVPAVRGERITRTRQRRR
jgi:hypothetical protein